MAVTPLAFPQGGIPDHPPLKIRCAGTAPGHSSAPALSRSLHFSLAALRQGRRRPFPLPHGPAPPLLFLARRFSSRRLPRPPTPEGARATPAPDGSVMSLAAVRKCRAGLAGCHAACKQQGTGRAAGGVTARAFSAGGPPALQPVTSFAFFFCFRFRRAAGNWAWAMPHPLG